MKAVCCRVEYRRPATRLRWVKVGKGVYVKLLSGSRRISKVVDALGECRGRFRQRIEGRWAMNGRVPERSDGGPDWNNE
jgi:hypothetical protein